MINRGNSVILLNETQMNTLIPEHFKSRYWVEGLDENDQPTYTAQTWLQLTESETYKLGHGGTPKLLNATLDNYGSPVLVGDVYAVSLAASAIRGDVGQIMNITTLYLNFSEANQFIADNTPTEI